MTVNLSKNALLFHQYSSFEFSPLGAEFNDIHSTPHHHLNLGRLLVQFSIVCWGLGEF